MQIITDKNKVNEVLTRGVEIIYPNRRGLEKMLLSGKRIKLYCGFDPSATSLHIGNAILINKLSQFQALGHEVVFLVGDFTGMIGDPTDKAATRTKLSREEVLENAKSYEKQASAWLDFDGDNPAKLIYNSEWSDHISFRDLIEISSNFTVQQMIQRDMFQKRLKDEKPIHLHEFLYPLAQAYDSVALGVDLEIGGNDQMFNMMCGRDLMKAMSNKEKFVMTMKLMADDAGKKMGKSEGNAVFLDQDPADIYGRVMSWPDGVICAAFELCTNVSLEQIDKYQNQLKGEQVNPRDIKMKLAHEITRIIHGDKEAGAAQDNFVKTIQNKETPDEIEVFETDKQKVKLVDLLAECGLAASKGEARRLIKQNGIKVDDKAVSDDNLELDIDAKGRVIKRGKRFFRKIILK